jgi:peptide/nickel transport system substrate-binding protein
MQHRRYGVDRRRLIGGAGAAALLGPGLASPARAQGRDRLIFGLSSYPPSIRPWTNTGTAASTVKVNFMRGLISYDDAGKLVPELAESWRAEGKDSLVLKLRENATFQDGAPVNAEAVTFNFNGILAEKSTAFYRGQLLNVVDKVEAVDKNTVRFKLKAPSATLPYLLASTHMMMISPKSTETNPVGAGPYRVTDIERGTRVDLDAWDGYYRKGLPRTKKLRFVSYADENLRVAALEAGDVDIIEYVPWQSMAKIESNAKLVLDTVDGPFMYLIFNVMQGPFKDARLRRAVAHAVERNDIVKAAFFGRGSICEGVPIPPGSEYFNKATSTHWKMDLDKARKLLAEAGMPGGFKATLLSTAQYGMHKDTAEVVQQSLKRIGIEAELRMPEWATRVNLGNRGQYDFAVMGSAGDYNDPDFLTQFIDGSQTASYGRSHGYSNPKINDLLKAGRGELDPAKRKAIYAEVEKIQLEDAVMVGLAWRSQGYGLRKEIKGFKNLPGFLTFYSGIRLEHVAMT